MHFVAIIKKPSVYQPTQIKGNKPIAIGLSYSMLSVSSEHKEGDAP
jgi:hypothetical protein